MSPTSGDSVHSLALSGNTVLGGTYYNGLFRIDGASTTQPSSAAAPLAAIARDPANSSSLIAGAWSEGIFTSADGGQSWSADSAGLGAIDVYSLAFAGSDRFAGTSAGVFRRGTTEWEPRSNGLAARNVFALLAVPPGVSWKLYAGTEHGLYASGDLGLSWQALSVGLGDVRVYALANAGLRLVAGTERGVFTSSNGGLSWAPSAPGVGVMPVRALAARASQPSVVFAGTAEGPFVSQDAGLTWAPFDKGLSGEARKVSSLALAGTTPETVYAGTGAGIWRNSFSAAAADSDGDGCSDTEENEPVERLGGRRDYLNPYDFFDVPLPPGAPGTGSKNGAINIFDVLGVLAKFGTHDNGTPNDFSDDPPNAGGQRYNPDFDRNGPPSAAQEPDPERREPWDLRAPDGVINIFDVLRVLAQFGHSCLGPPEG